MNPLILDALLAAAMGAGIFFATSLFIGEKRAKYLPGGAVGAAWSISPLYLSIPAALVGHLLAVWLMSRVRE